MIVQAEFWKVARATAKPWDGEPFASGRAARIEYAAGGPALDVREIFTWDRGDLAAPVMSSSSGPKDYVKNQIWGLFNANPRLARVVMVRAEGPPFLLLKRDDGFWFDVTGVQVANADQATTAERQKAVA